MSLIFHRRDGRFRMEPVGTWGKSGEVLLLDEMAVRWPEGVPDGVVPESVCSHACRPSQFRIQLEQKCCWECRDCRNNEIVISNGTTCAECDALYWPDVDNSSVCLPITPTSYTWGHTMGMMCVTASLVGMALCLVVFAFYVRHRDKPLIKGTTRELSIVGLVGALIAYLSAVLMISQPTTSTCYLSHVGAHLGFCVTYASLLTVSWTDLLGCSWRESYIVRLHTCG